ncbi:choice-of-anchor tandem repeat GloVer-containing protein [Ideonella sp. YS5]
MPQLTRRAALGCLAGTILAPSARAADHGFEVVHFFEVDDGYNPNGSLVQTPDGRLHGTTHGGGQRWHGTVFSSSTRGRLKVQASFSKHGAAGWYPYAPLCIGADGRLYGANYYGGPGNFGTLFAVESTGDVTPMHQFGYTDGSLPLAGLMAASDGNLYGCTSSGGEHFAGVFYRLTPSGAFTVLRSLENAPKGELIEASDGYFYGTTSSGGVGQGAVIRLSPDGATLDEVHAFAADGHEGTQADAALLQASDGSLVGVAHDGGPAGFGTVFRVGLGGGLEVLHGFTGGRGSGHPGGGLIELSPGQFHGVTHGGTGDGGVVYRLDPDRSLRVLHRFADQDNVSGYRPKGRLLAASDGRLYGTTYFAGGIFRLKP